MSRRRKRLKELPPVWIVNLPRGGIALRWPDPSDPSKIRQEKLDGVRRRRDAESFRLEKAEQLAAEMQLDDTDWESFRLRYETERLPALARRTADPWKTVANWAEKLMRPRSLHDITASWLSRFQSKLRDNVPSEASIASYLRALRSALSWAVSIGLIDTCPRFSMPVRAKASKLMKGRPVTTEEFERMLASVGKALHSIRKESRKTGAKRRRKPLAVSAEIVASWQYLVRGLWFSGLRIEEALALYWDRLDRLHVHKLEARRPMLRIRQELEKGAEDRLLPITPDFAEFLRQTPDAQRCGAVFKPLGLSGKECRGRGTVSRYISKAGELARVVVNVEASGKVKYASAHDLRRSFGDRWAPRVMPVVLKELMRHQSIETTMKYYVGINAERTADAVWEAFGARLRDQTRDAPQNSIDEAEQR